MSRRRVRTLLRANDGSMPLATCAAGPPRPPCTDLPDEWREAAVTNGRAWADLCRRYREEAP